MKKPAKRQLSPVFSSDIIVVVGGYGSGKSEVSVNLARYLAKGQPKPVAIADLDIVNPYFRSREAEKALQQLGIRTLNPTGDYSKTELPIILPEIKGAIESHPGLVILDVGGDEVGARVLSSLAESFEAGAYEMLLVLNANRPFTSDVPLCLKLMDEIESSSRLRFTGLISNTHLLEATDEAEVLTGLKLALEVGGARGLRLVFVSVLENLAAAVERSITDVPVLALRRQLLKPWERLAAGTEER
jgi:hypothetical protein